MLKIEPVQIQVRSNEASVIADDLVLIEQTQSLLMQSKQESGYPTNNDIKPTALNDNIITIPPHSVWAKLNACLSVTPNWLPKMN